MINKGFIWIYSLIYDILILLVSHSRMWNVEIQYYHKFAYIQKALSACLIDWYNKYIVNCRIII